MLQGSGRCRGQADTHEGEDGETQLTWTTRRSPEDSAHRAESGRPREEEKQKDRKEKMRKHDNSCESYNSITIKGLVKKAQMTSYFHK